MMQNERANLLNLPWEIRLQILEHLVRSLIPLCRISRVVSIPRQGNSTRLRRRDHTHGRFELGARLNLYPQILGVCRQLYHEAYPILYNNRVVISIGMYQSFSPVDILGHGRIEDLIEPGPGSRLPKLENFVNFEFVLYIDFTRPDVWLHANALGWVCSNLQSIRSLQLETVVIRAWDESHGTRYCGSEGQTLWQRNLNGLWKLRCRNVSFGGDIPKMRDLEKWIKKIMVS